MERRAHQPAIRQFGKESDRITGQNYLNYFCFCSELCSTVFENAPESGWRGSSNNIRPWRCPTSRARCATCRVFRNAGGCSPPATFLASGYRAAGDGAPLRRGWRRRAPAHTSITCSCLSRVMTTPTPNGVSSAHLRTRRCCRALAASPSTSPVRTPGTVHRAGQVETDWPGWPIITVLTMITQHAAHGISHKMLRLTMDAKIVHVWRTTNYQHHEFRNSKRASYHELPVRPINTQLKRNVSFTTNCPSIHNYHVWKIEQEAAIKNVPCGLPKIRPFR